MSARVLTTIEDLPRVERCLTETDISLSESARREMILLSQGPGMAVLVTASPLSPTGRTQVRDLRARAQQRGYLIKAEYQATPDLIAAIYRHMAMTERRDRLESGEDTDARTAAKNDFDALVFHAGEEGASDIHIVLKGKIPQVLYRIHGELGSAGLGPEWTRERLTELCACTYTVLAENREPTWDPTRRQDASIARQIAGRTYRLRYAHHPIAPEGVHVVLRLLSTGQGIRFAPNLESLGYSEEQAAAILAMVAEPSGLIILSGETGSGKSTTLANLMHILLENSGGTLSLQTVEDPPEYEVPGVIQSPVIHRRDDREKGVNPFVDAIVGAMRCDPDILVVGEIRDIDTAMLALSMAESGHPVLGTVHARRALGIISRLEIMGANRPVNPISRDILCAPGFISGLIHQALLPVLCDHCAVPFERSEAARRDPGLVARALAVSGRDFGRLRGRGPGCQHCRKGIRGRTGCAEVVVPDATMLQLLREHRDKEAMEHWLGAAGGFSIRDHAIDKMRAGLIAPEDVEGCLGRLRSEATSARKQRVHPLETAQ